NLLLELSGDTSLDPLVLIVINALNKYDKGENIQIILILLAKARKLKIVRLRIFLISRPEILIRNRFIDIEYK
ncbi:hypothetical protein F5882DRAFT_242438, partial [Hyaloscypha sp. PMI_1271]